jgi:dTDP-4-amino-4,6-dideoxygalactose transaminase
MFTTNDPALAERISVLRDHGSRKKYHYDLLGMNSRLDSPSPLHLQPAFAYVGHHPGAFPQSEEASQHVLALPVFPQMTEEQQKMVVDGIAQFFAEES